MPYSVRYTPAAAAEVANAIGWYDPPDINQAASVVREIDPAKARPMSGSELVGRVKGDFRRDVLGGDFEHNPRSGRTHAMANLYLRAKLPIPFWGVA